MPLELENAADLSKLVGIQYHRVLDNAVIELDAESLWVQLNYQLIHLLDFLPSANWVSVETLTVLYWLYCTYWLHWRLTGRECRDTLLRGANTCVPERDRG